MSGALTPPSAIYGSVALTDAEKTEVRRFCGYPSYGANNSQIQSWRFNQQYGFLEFRMVNASASELQVIRQYLTQLWAMEAALPSIGGTLGVDTAGPFKRNASEQSERYRMLDTWRRRFVAFFGVAPGPELGSPGAITI